MSTLFNITGDFLTLYEQIDLLDPEDEDYNDMMTAIIDTCEGLEGERDIKLENIALYIKQLEADAKAIKEETDRLTKRKKAKENKIDSLKRYAMKNMQEFGIKKVETPRAVLNIGNSTVCTINNENELIKWAENNAPDIIRQKAPEVNKMILRKHLQAGMQIDSASLETNQTLRIK